MYRYKLYMVSLTSKDNCNYCNAQCNTDQLGTDCNPSGSLWLCDTCLEAGWRGAPAPRATSPRKSVDAAVAAVVEKLEARSSAPGGGRKKKRRKKYKKTRKHKNSRKQKRNKKQKRTSKSKRRTRTKSRR